MISIACYAANEKKRMHKENKETTVKWKLVTRVIKIVERKEVVAAFEEMMQQIKETELNQSSELNLQSPTGAKKRNNK